MSVQWKGYAGVAALAAFAFALRIWSAAERAATATLTGMVDSQIYLQLAQRLPENHWLPEQGFYMSPLYPYLLALLQVDADNVWPILILQSLLGVVGLVALAVVAGRYAGSAATYATLLLGALCAPIAVYDVSLLSDGPAFAAFAMGLALLVLRGPKWRVLLFVGSCFALAYALRANFLLPVLLCGIWILRGRLRVAWAYALPLVLTLLVLAALNQGAEGRFTPRSFNAGQNLYIGNNAASDGSYTTLNEIHPGDMMGRAAAERARGRALDAAEIEGFWRSQALDYWKSNVGASVTLILRKFVLFFHPHEMPQMESLDLVRKESTALRISVVGMLLLLPLAAVGLLSLNAVHRRELLPFWLSLGSALLICLVFFVNGRLRLPMHLTLLPLAGMGASALVVGARSGHWKRPITILAAGIGLLFVMALYPTHGAYRSALSAARYAVLEGLAGDRSRALEWMRIEMEIENADAGVWNRPAVSETTRTHEEARWLLQSETAAAWFVLDELRRAFADMAPAADAMPRNMRAQEGLLEICRRLTESGLGGIEVEAAAQRARQRLQSR